MTAPWYTDDSVTATPDRQGLTPTMPSRRPTPTAPAPPAPSAQDGLDAVPRPPRSAARAAR